ncbi:MAG: hypothetical protein Q4B92_07595, partial [Ruminococcus sp.]|nr:hypothetical protein [Ruminococcus sp.]
QYVAYIPVEYENFIVTNGTDQTIDLPITGNGGYWMDAKNADGKYDMGTWNPNFYELPSNNDPTDPIEDPTTEATEPSATTEATEPSSEVTVPTTIPTEPTSTPDETDPTTEPSTVVVDGYYLGDVDSNEVVNIKDATLIQKVLARFKGLTYDADAALVNDNDYLDISDATTIQKFVAKLLPEDTNVGKFFER